MKAKEFLKLIESGKDIKNFYLVPVSYLCMGFVPGSGGTLKIWGYYPFQIHSLGFSPSGKIFFNVTIVNKLGTSYEHNDFLTSQKKIKYAFDRHLEFFETEEEAIRECHLRNRGKMGPGPCHNIDMRTVKEEERQYVEAIFY